LANDLRRGTHHKSMKAAVIVFPGSNREQDALRALDKIANAKLSIVWHGAHALPVGTDLVVLPGGFSYGDYLRCGAIAARAPVMDAVRAHAAGGGLVLGICNGFQILVEAGLLPGVLMRNANLRFVCRMQHLTVARNDTPFTSHYAKGEIIKVAVAHGEGNFTADSETVSRLEGEGRVAFRYCDARGGRHAHANPNGSVNDIAGIYSENFRVLGLMPHPENLIDPLVGGTDGRGLFESVAAFCEESAPVPAR
jgi:phosphoribosylformylglycinamidine synthase subunit PurQ / glutaminase